MENENSNVNFLQATFWRSYLEYTNGYTRTSPWITWLKICLGLNFVQISINLDPTPPHDLPKNLKLKPIVSNIQTIKLFMSMSKLANFAVDIQGSVINTIVEMIS